MANNNFAKWLPDNLTQEERRKVIELAKLLKFSPVACGAVAVMMLEECNHHDEAKELNDNLLS